MRGTPLVLLAFAAVLAVAGGAGAQALEYLLNGDLEGPVGPPDAAWPYTKQGDQFILSLRGSDVDGSIVASGSQSVFLAKAGTSSDECTTGPCTGALGRLQLGSLGGVRTREIAGLSWSHWDSTTLYGLQFYLHLDSDRDGVRDMCLVSTVVPAPDTGAAWQSEGLPLDARIFEQRDDTCTPMSNDPVVRDTFTNTLAFYTSTPPFSDSIVSGLSMQVHPDGNLAWDWNATRQCCANWTATGDVRVDNFSLQVQQGVGGEDFLADFTFTPPLANSLADGTGTEVFAFDAGGEVRIDVTLTDSAGLPRYFREGAAAPARLTITGIDGGGQLVLEDASPADQMGSPGKASFTVARSALPDAERFRLLVEAPNERVTDPSPNGFAFSFYNRAAQDAIDDGDHPTADTEDEEGSEVVLPWRVGIEATINVTKEEDLPPAPGEFTVTRGGTTAGDLDVNYTVSGTARPGSDYNALSGTITIPDGASSTTIDVLAFDDERWEGVEVVRVALDDLGAYDIDPSAASATVEIIDDELDPIDYLMNGDVEDDVATTGTPRQGFGIALYDGAKEVAAPVAKSEQAVDMAVPGTRPQNGTLSFLVLRAVGGTRLAELEGVAFQYQTAARTDQTRLSFYINFDTDGDGERDFCLIHDYDGPMGGRLPPTGSSYVEIMADESTLYREGSSICKGLGNPAQPLSVFQSDPTYRDAMVISTSFQTLCASTRNATGFPCPDIQDPADGVWKKTYVGPSWYVDDIRMLGRYDAPEVDFLTQYDFAPGLIPSSTQGGPSVDIIGFDPVTDTARVTARLYDGDGGPRNVMPRDGADLRLYIIDVDDVDVDDPTSYNDAYTASYEDGTITEAVRPSLGTSSPGIATFTVPRSAFTDLGAERFHLAVESIHEPAIKPEPPLASATPPMEGDHPYSFFNRDAEEQFQNQLYTLADMTDAGGTDVLLPWDIEIGSVEDGHETPIDPVDYIVNRSEPYVGDLDVYFNPAFTVCVKLCADNNDIPNVPTNVTIRDGERSALIEIPVVDDLEVEDKEELWIGLDDRPTYDIDPDEDVADGFILDNELPEVWIEAAGGGGSSYPGEASAEEGGQLDFTIRRRGMSEIDLQVCYRGTKMDPLPLFGDNWHADVPNEAPPSTPGPGDDIVLNTDCADGTDAMVEMPAGVTQVNITVDTADDEWEEYTEWFFLELIDDPGTPPLYTASQNGDNRTAAVIYDDGDRPKVVFDLATIVDGREGDGVLPIDGNITVRRTETDVDNYALDVRFDHVGGTADIGSALGDPDFVFSDGAAMLTDTTITIPENPSPTVTVPPTSVTTNITIDVGEDTVHETTETVDLELVPSPSRYRLDPLDIAGTVLIFDDEDVPILRVVKVVDAQEPSTNGTFRFERSNTENITEDLFVSYNVTDPPIVTDSALPHDGSLLACAVGDEATPCDYVALPGNVTIDAGNYSANVTVDVLDDIMEEPDQTVTVELNFTDGTYTEVDPLDSVATVLILDDGDRPRVYSTFLSHGDEVVGGPPVSGFFNLTRITENVTYGLAVDYTVRDVSTATPDNVLASCGGTPACDYVAIGIARMVPIGMWNETVKIDVHEDQVQEKTENVTVHIDNRSDEEQGADGYGYLTLPDMVDITINITDDGDLPVIEIVAVKDAFEPATDGLFRIKRNSTENLSAPLVVDFEVGTGSIFDVALPDGDPLVCVVAGNPPCDYVALPPGQITIAENETTFDIPVEVHDDEMEEPNQTVHVTILDNTTYHVGPAPLDNATVTIHDDGDLPIVEVHHIANATELNEVVGQAIVRRITEMPTYDLDVEILVGGNATRDVDYVLDTDPVMPGPQGVPAIIPARDLPTDGFSVILNVTPLQDLIDEWDQNVTFEIQPVQPPTYVIGPGNGSTTVYIIDDEPLPKIWACSYDEGCGLSVDPELDEGVTTLLPYHIKLNFTPGVVEETEKTVIVDHRSQNGTAKWPLDFVYSEGTVTFLPGEGGPDDQRTVYLTVLGDILDESDETIYLRLDVTNAAPADDLLVRGMIVDDDEPLITVRAAPRSASEGVATAGAFLVERQNSDNSTPLSVQFKIAGTATPDDDFGLAVPDAVFTPGQGVAPVGILPVDDLIEEDDETIILTLDPGAGYTLASPSDRATFTILDNDLPLVSIRNLTGSAHETGPVHETLVLERGTTHLGQPMNVRLAVAGDATSGQDYAPLPEVVTFPPGQAVLDVPLTVLQDAIEEDVEVVEVHIVAQAGYRIDPERPMTAVYIHDDDVAGIILEGPKPGPVEVDETGVSNVVFVRLAARPNGTVTVLLEPEFDPLVSQYSINGIPFVRFDESDWDERKGVTIRGKDDTLLDGANLTYIKGTVYGFETDAPEYLRDPPVVPATKEVIIYDDDFVVNVTVTPGTLQEGDPPAEFTFRRSYADPIAPTVVALSLGGGATPGLDYEVFSLPVTIPPGATETTASITALEDAEQGEPPEAVVLRVRQADRYQVGSPAMATVRITDGHFAGLGDEKEGALAQRIDACLDHARNDVDPEDCPDLGPPDEEPDRDGDGVADGADNCPAVANRDQEDLDDDGRGDACDQDRDGDGVFDTSPYDFLRLDNCPEVHNPLQADADEDGLGDACDDETDPRSASVKAGSSRGDGPPGGTGTTDATSGRADSMADAPSHLGFFQGLALMAVIALLAGGVLALLGVAVFRR